MVVMVVVVVVVVVWWWWWWWRRWRVVVVVVVVVMLMMMIVQIKWIPTSLLMVGCCVMRDIKMMIHKSKDTLMLMLRLTES